MKVLVVAHRMELGGTQVNAIDLAAEVQKAADVQVLMAAAPGPSVGMPRAAETQLRRLPDPARHPSLNVIRALDTVEREFHPDLVHVWDWTQCFDAYPGLYLQRRLPVLCSVMSMVVPRFIPRQLTTTFGTVQLAEKASRMRRGPVRLLEPPVDLEANHPGVSDGEAFRLAHGVAPDQILVVMVSRLESWLKLESLQRGIAAVEQLARRHPVRLVIVGEGSATAQVAARAAAANATLGREVVSLAGGRIDPRPAYEAADIMMGMGGSALRTMAFATPLIVMGERGFSRVLDRSTLPTFLYQGWYGLGTGRYDDLESQLERLVESPAERHTLGQLGLATVRERYDLKAAAAALVGYYEEAATQQFSLSRGLFEGFRTAGLVGGRSAQRAVTTRTSQLIRERQ